MHPQRKKLLDQLNASPLLMGRVCVPAMFTRKSAPFHYQLERDYLNHLPLCNVIAPRGFAKTSVVGGIFPLHHLFADLHLRAKDDRRFVLVVSKTREHAEKVVETLTSITSESEEFIKLYGYHGITNARRWSKHEVEFDTGDILMARGMGQQLVGLKKKHQRPTFVILDDPEDMNNTKTPEAMQFNLHWLLQTLLPIVDRTKHPRVMVIGTPQNEACLIFTLKQSKHWLTRHYSAEVDVEKQITLWPEHISWKALMGIRAMYEGMRKLSSYNREYLCTVTGGEDQLWREEDIHTWDGTHRIEDGRVFLVVTHRDGVQLPRPEELEVNVFAGVDPASSVRKTADYSVVMLLGVDYLDRRYVIQYHRVRLRPMDLVALLDRVHEAIPVKRWGIETVAYQEMVRDYLRRSRKIYPGLEKKNQPRTPKSDRIESLQPWTHSGRMMLKVGMQELKQEMLFYPRNRNDDCLDGLFFAQGASLSYVLPKRRRVEKDVERPQKGGDRAEDLEMEDRYAARSYMLA